MVIAENDTPQKKKTSVSELRQDIVTGDWVIIATGRGKRPDDFVVSSRAEGQGGPDIFADPKASGQEEDTLIYMRPDGEWSLRVFPNKYPAVSRSNGRPKSLADGPYFGMSAVGYHEVIVTHDAKRSIAELETWQVAELLDAYQDRYLSLMNKASVNYIQIFHNHGQEAGASITHPHSQLMAIPVVAPYVESILSGAERFYKSHRQRVYGVMVDYELEKGKRLVFENDDFVVFAPYASRVAFELWVVGKRPCPYFERITDEEKFTCAEALQKALQSIYKGLGDPAYNFYLYTAPCDGKDYPHFQWHIEIAPHTSTWAGFELSTGIEISSIEPEMAAAFLREKLENE
jgi:UDPglucose--hexose-1-phosphate uridylyltransferase